MRSVVLIDNEPFTKRRGQLFYIDRLKQDGFEVKIWDMSAFFPANNNLVDMINADYVRKINSITDLNNELSNTDIPSTFFIVESAWLDCSLPIYRTLVANKCFISRFYFYSNIIQVPTKSWGEKGLLRFIYLICSYGKKPFTYLIRKYKWRGIKYDIYLSPIKEEGVTGGLNHPDYNDFKFNKEEPILQYNYIVFCDQYFPLHPDIIRFTSELCAEKYYLSMRKLFDHVEEITGLPVVIASHPKAKYDGTEFGERKIIKYQTKNLVVNSDKVIFHTTNSLSYSVMADKDVLCVYTDDFKSYTTGYQLLLGIKKALGLHPYNIDQEDMSKVQFESYNEKLRREYIYKYLTTKETENVDNYITIASTIIEAKYTK